GRAFPGPCLFVLRTCARTAKATISKRSAPIALKASCLGFPARFSAEGCSAGVAARRRGGSARADPDAAGGADCLHPAAGGDPSAGAAAAGVGELDHRRVRVHPEALRFLAA